MRANSALSRAVVVPMLLEQWPVPVIGGDEGVLSEGIINVGTSVWAWLRDVMNALQENDQLAGLDEQVLVVDDDPALRTLIASVLRKRGYTVLEAGQADEAFRMACVETPALVVSDLFMGATSGLDLLARLRAHANTAHISVILMTGASTDSAVGKGMDSGADDYLAKPFRIDELCRSVEAQFHKRRRSGRDDP